MNCGQALQLVQAFGDGELDAEGQSLVREHLRTCAACRATYDERRRLVQNLAAALVSEASAPADLTRSVSQRIAARPMHGLRSLVSVLGKGRSLDPTESRVYGYVHGCPENPSERSSLRDSAISRPTYCAKLNRPYTLHPTHWGRPMRVAFSVAGVIGVVLALTWMLFGRELALAKAIDEAMRQVKSAHFTAVEGERRIEVWATPEAERVASDEGWMIAKDGKAYLFDSHRKRVTITKGPLAQLQLLRGLNVLLLSARVRGQVRGEPTVAKKTVTLPDGRKAIRITASGKAKVLGVTGDFTGTMLVDPATNLIMSGEVTERTPQLEMGEEAVRPSSSAHTTHVKVDSISYNVPVPSGIFDTTTPRGWKVTRR